MTTTVLRAVKFVGEGIDSINERDDVRRVMVSSKEILEITAALTGPILLPFIIVTLASQGNL
jgi:hypothetical protein